MAGFSPRHTIQVVPDSLNSAGGSKTMFLEIPDETRLYDNQSQPQPVHPPHTQTHTPPPEADSSWAGFVALWVVTFGTKQMVYNITLKSNVEMNEDCL